MGLSDPDVSMSSDMSGGDGGSLFAGVSMVQEPAAPAPVASSSFAAAVILTFLFHLLDFFPAHFLF